MEFLFLLGAFVVFMFVTASAFARRYKRCPSDKILVVYGKIAGGEGLSAKLLPRRCGSFVWPIIQDYQFLDLTPIPIDIKLEGALSQQNIRVNTPSTFTVGISTEPGVMENAAERILGLSGARSRISPSDIIFGQMRVVIATMPIEEINADRDKLIENISNGVEVELKKVGLRLINVNIQDITDESGYIDALGKEAAARAINEAKIKVAEQMKERARSASAPWPNATSASRFRLRRGHGRRRRERQPRSRWPARTPIGARPRRRPSAGPQCGREGQAGPGSPGVVRGRADGGETPGPSASRRRSTPTSWCPPRSRSSASRRWPRPRPSASAA